MAHTRFRYMPYCMVVVTQRKYTIITQFSTGVTGTQPKSVGPDFQVIRVLS